MTLFILRSLILVPCPFTFSSRPKNTSRLAPQVPLFEAHVAQRWPRLERLFRLGLKCEDVRGVGRKCPEARARSMP